MLQPLENRGVKSMSDATGLDLTRRGFLKAAGATAGAAGLAACGMTSVDAWLGKAEAADVPEEHVAYMRHQFHCLSECCLKCTIRDGRLCKIEPNDAAPEFNRHVCLRGLSEIQHVYATDRLQTPLKRVGERGEGKFEAITWDEAIKTIHDEIQKSRDKYGDSSFFFRKSTEASVGQGFEFLGQLLHADDGYRWGLDRGSANGFDPAIGKFGFLPKNSSREFSDASTVILWGNNMLESGLTWSGVIMDAKEAGTYFVGIDPRFSPTCGKCDQYVPINPGTDPALALALINVVLDNEWYDEDFMKAYTGFPFLVNKATGEIRGTTSQTTSAAGKVTETKLADVWDSTSGAAHAVTDEGIDPALTGTHVIDGVTYVTEFDLLKDAMKQYTPEWAEGITGISADVITDLAERYATGGPAMISFGLGGPDKYANADILGHSLLVLTAITGNTGKTGTGTGWYGAGGGFASGDGLGAWTLPDEYGYEESGISMYDFPYKENNIHVAMTFGDVFTLEAANANVMLDWVKGLDFFAICDIYHSSAVDYADIVLPAATKFECEEDLMQIRDGKGLLSISQKCIDPLFESKSDLQIERLLAAQWGLEDVLPKSYEELAEAQMNGAGIGNMKGFTIQKLLDNQCVLQYLPSKAADRLTFNTPSKRIEPYYENELNVGQAWPTYENANESYPDNPKKSDYPIAFMQGKTRFRIHAYYSASSWFQEYYDPCVNMNPEDAAARGIKTNDDVHVFNDRGEFVARALVNPAIKPGTVFMAETTYNHYYKNGFLQNVTNDFRQERCYPMIFGPQIPYNDTLVQIEKA